MYQSHRLFEARKPHDLPLDWLERHLVSPNVDFCFLLEAVIGKLMFIDTDAHIIVTILEIDGALIFVILSPRLRFFDCLVFDDQMETFRGFLVTLLVLAAVSSCKEVIRADDGRILSVCLF